MCGNSGYKALLIYQKAFQLTMSVFNMTRAFTEDERFGLALQVRRSSRSVCTRLVEGYRKRMYPPEFTHQLIICDGAAKETVLWLEVALGCGYISQAEFDQNNALLNEIGYMLAALLRSPGTSAPAMQSFGSA